MLTAEQQSAIVAALELGSEVKEIGTGGWEYGTGKDDPLDVWKGWWRVSRDDRGHRCSWLPLDCSTQEHYDAACWRVARWLMLTHRSFVYPIGPEWLLIPAHGGVDSGKNLWCDADRDNYLAALVSAAREVMG